MLDDMDRRLLRYWQAEPSLSPGELAERCGMTPGKAARRIAKMEDDGIVQGVSAVVNWAALGYAVEVSLRVTLDKTQSNAFDAFLAEARQVPEVIEVQTFLGRVDVRLSIIARDMAHYQQIYRSRILTLPHIADIEALMQVARIKSEQTLPI
ncbi:Lrp/AsnC family transcriptional regulator [Sulfitobacter mediterraneus]|jgi:Lrp/AsnC family transcriptional regulator|uniref:AsnC family transcriptional regulator n=1 Tax=Sulfitobacter mediterraneus TaxID=83219 RepID=A0A2T6CIE5_9RHOB|nr:Lrp/AsnC family transcriptional regulator [Sulfitobacter mediterraneus]KIN76530.1 Transcriptional regulator, AsnC family [Sulfitobacter mediterraneus KCTC 32188]MBM1309411.1 Lrp/AsnC family transcriptional regulator [Sulfitobacter mediterraneus]MBM1313296.1 Lrp/AsnC family transcriptional regulator [Sulfitobacter mediterraneus]MBM1321680.1 Lrp/AsnC family transcriptional regulator [Sulfitobacter mediterraneus]MBM1325567.1 Lrp/AsnC family transcriptional regulator [Sulfitobacter mediterraneu